MFLYFLFGKVVFRSYYILMGILFIILYILIKTVQFKVKNMNKKNNINYIYYNFLFQCMPFIYTSQFISYEDYERLINVRYNVPNEGAVSAINNWIDDRGKSFIIYG